MSEGDRVLVVQFEAVTFGRLSTSELASAAAGNLSMRKSFLAVLVVTLHCQGQEAIPKDPVTAITDAFKTHDVVLLGGTDGSIQEDQLLLRLIRSREFSAAVSTITISCNSLYQPLVDRYVAGDTVPADQLQLAWRNSLAIGPVPDKPFEELLAGARAANQSSPSGQRKLRIVCTDGPVDWERVQSRADLDPFVPNRDENFVKIVKDQILSKHQKGLLSMGALHFRRTDGKGSMVERNLQQAGATTYLVVAGSNIVGTYDERDPRFLKWKSPWMMDVRGTWLAALPAKPLLMGGNASNARITGPLSETTDAFLFLGPPEELKMAVPKRSALDGTQYGKETERRLRVIFGEGRKLPDFIPKDDTGLAAKYLPAEQALSSPQKF